MYPSNGATAARWTNPSVTVVAVTWKGVVKSVVNDGVAVTVAIEWAGVELRILLLAGRGLARSLAAGEPVPLSVRPERVHLIPLER